MARAIHISSINREKTGENRPDNFLLKFNPPLKLDPEMKHSIAIDRLTMNYSWYNIRSSYKNNTIKYTNDRGVNWYTITFKDGMYSYTDINEYLRQYMEQKNHHTTDQRGNKVFHININFILSTYRLTITRLQLFVPRLVFNSEGQKLYMENYLKPYKWTYLKETVFTSNVSTQNSGYFRITNGISKPRHVFVFSINNGNINNQLQNPFLYNTFSISTNPRTSVILKFEMEMNIQEFITNQQKILQEFFVM